MESALWVASDNGHADVVQLLIKWKAQVDSCDLGSICKSEWLVGGLKLLDDFYKVVPPSYKLVYKPH